MKMLNLAISGLVAFAGIQAFGKITKSFTAEDAIAAYFQNQEAQKQANPYSKPLYQIQVSRDLGTSFTLSVVYADLETECAAEVDVVSKVEAVPGMPAITHSRLIVSEARSIGCY